MPRQHQSRRNRSGRYAAAAVALCGALAVSSLWEEPPGDDAGSLPGDEQNPFPPNLDVDSIDGSLGFDAPAIINPTHGGESDAFGREWLPGAGSAPTASAMTAIDMEDMYRVVVDRPFIFRVLADPQNPDNEIDVSLYVFDRFGRGVLANRNLTNGMGALLLPEANDGTGAMLEQRGAYFLAVAEDGRYPVANSTGGPVGEIFSFDPNFAGEISGPDGIGGLNPIIGWAGPAANSGKYFLQIDGARAPLARCPADFTTTNTNPGDPLYGVPDNLVNGADLSFFVEKWITGDIQADVTTSNTNPGDVFFGVPDLDVDGADLSYFIELWLFGCPVT